ncbi:MAG: helix-turn-helix domain-containing protein [Desulfohalobiaceae bacterium]|nr:helix-turn-helix domain-containing protein [Desulfohalobiaceae bacterium]
MSEQSFQAFFERLKSVSFIQNQSQLAHFLQVGRASVSLAKHKNQVPNRWIVTLSRELNLNADWLARGRGSPHLEPQAENSRPAHLTMVAPRLNAEGEWEPTGANSPQTLQFDADFLAGLGAPERMVALTVGEESMHPEIRLGDLVLVDQSSLAIRSGCIYALGMEGEVVLRRLEKLPQRMVLYADNANYPARDLRKSEWESIRLLGRVVLVCRSV